MMFHIDLVQPRHMTMLHDYIFFSEQGFSNLKIQYEFFNWIEML